MGPRIPKPECRRVLDTLFSSIVEALQQGDLIEFRGLGTFRVGGSKARGGAESKYG
ncbi:MAG: hypothetical protein F4058_01060 [Rhodothermaceae bacterium]|nr:hypothetical protein [Rhodothermaceae bacterium]MYF63894.1 hypothetical protein [Rhodothermaceae bacterium]MYI83900.1 hypothetical protein [Rhodothermaceae bacterium]